MAIVDPRVLQLVEALIETGADWLAFEIVEGVQAGAVPEEPPETLLRIQENVRSRTSPIKMRGFADTTVPLSRPRLGDEQLVWATSYVYQRLGDALSMFTHSFDHIGEILQPDSMQDRSPSAATTTGRTHVLLQADEQGIEVNRQGLDDAIKGLTQLRRALNTWLESVGTEGRIE